MALLFSHVRVSTPDGNEAEFLVAGIPREFEDVEGYTKLDEFLTEIDEDTEISFHKQHQSRGFEGLCGGWNINPTANTSLTTTKTSQGFLSLVDDFISPIKV